MKIELAATAFIFHKDKLLLIKRKSGSWAQVGGHVEKDEVPDDALIREIKEETNLDVDVIRPPALIGDTEHSKELIPPFFVHIHDAKDGTHRHLCYDYVAVAKNPTQLKTEEKEIDDHAWVSKEELKDFDLFDPLKKMALKAFDVYEEHSKTFKP